MIDGVKELFIHHAIRSAVFIGHSFGTTCVAWFVNEAPWLVHSCYFNDPVCFLLNEPDVCFNFMYRTPTNPIQLLLYYFSARELGISTVMRRHFWWYVTYIDSIGLIILYLLRTCLHVVKYGLQNMIKSFIPIEYTITSCKMELMYFTEQE
jgi:hypothetical protein